MGSRNGQDAISIRGAREHNLKDVSLDIPHGKFVVVTGVSGSGKSTLAFDLVFNEGQRRFLDSMSAYARQFIEQMARPDVDVIAGIPPTVSIEQGTSRGGGKSTVATVTEVYHFIRLLFARLGTQHCPACEIPVAPQTRSQLADTLRAESRRRGALKLLAPVIRNRKGFHSSVVAAAAKNGFEQVRADGAFYDTAEPFRLDRFKEHDIEVLVGEWNDKRRKKSGAELHDVITAALRAGNGIFYALDRKGELTIHSTERACPRCGTSFAKLDPKNFSYNSSQGWCARCRGFGELFYMPDVDRGARADVIEESWFMWQEGEREQCPGCQGARLNPLARAVRLDLGSKGQSAPTIDFFAEAGVAEAHEYFRKLNPSGGVAAIARDILPEITERLKFLREVGLGYLQLGRGVPTLSGGESQRIRLAAQLGSNLSGVLYVLDEPTIGLHARDNEQLLNTLERLRQRGNSLLVVEHDEDTMRRADFVVDLGPGAGVNGGHVVATGKLAELATHPDSITGSCLGMKRSFPARGKRREINQVRGRKPGVDSRWLTLSKADRNNLKNIETRIPLGRFVVVTGVSGSGKSTLIRDCLHPALELAVAANKKKKKAKLRELTGYESISAVYEVDQSPIGRTPRSTPATYVGFFDEIRKLFAQTPEARLRGYGPGRFSFNSPAGRCPDCDGAGQNKIEMNFLPAAFVKCETCDGLRFDPETLDVEFHGRNISQVLDLSVEQAIEFFSSFQKIKRALEALRDTGLEYLRLGQPSPTLSGGEAQRVKLVTHLLSGLKDPDLFTRLPRRNFFILEEPTIGLHMADVNRLVEVIQRLVDFGHTVVVIEHNLDLIAEADWVIDLGPEGGDAGGRIIAEGTPEKIAAYKTSHTGRYLKKTLRGNSRKCS
tara:strand:- start:3120 stop:5789 length:2670 start_codon:yes stop_codon:yes gene_type:complete